MRNFVTTFDNDKNEIRLAINVNAPDGTEIKFKLNGAQIFGIIFGALAVIAIVLLAIRCCIKAKKRKDANKYAIIHDQGNGKTIGSYH